MAELIQRSFQLRTVKKRSNIGVNPAPRIHTSTYIWQNSPQVVNVTLPLENQSWPVTFYGRWEESKQMLAALHSSYQSPHSPSCKVCLGQAFQFCEWWKNRDKGKRKVRWNVEFLFPFSSSAGPSPPPHANDKQVLTFGSERLNNLEYGANAKWLSLQADAQVQRETPKSVTWHTDYN